MEKRKLLNLKIFLGVCGFFFAIIVALYFVNSKKSYAQIPSNVLNMNNSSSNEALYLSDIPYQKAEIGWKTIGLDKTNDNASLIMKIDGAAVVVKKGIWAHATSTVEYDISNYKGYDYFITYYGLNTSAGNTGNGVKFYIYTSQDGKTWSLRTEQNPTPLKGVDNAIRVKIDIKDANYIRLYAHDNGSNASDHAVWGDAKLVKEGYSDNPMMTVEEFDKIIKEHYNSGAITDDLELFLLQRNFIKNFGQYQLRSFLESDSKNYETLNWFINNEEALRLWTIGGKPSGSYEKSLQVLSNLYHTYKEDLSNEGVTALGTKYKDLYLRMMLSLSLSHSANVGLWIGGNQLSNAVNRYKIYKQMHLDGLLDTAMFESYTIDEMRGVMATNIDDEEILWLHDYSKKYSTPAERFNPYKYITYTFNYGYYRPKYYSQENYAMWDKKYNLSKYNVPYQAGKPKLWIVFEEGSVCGGLSKTACNLYGVWGYPARVVGQPGHAAYVYLYNAGGGKYAWQLSNSVSSTGWTNTTGGGYNGWGSRYSTSNNTISTGSYLLLAQEAQNEYDKYERAGLILLLEDVYKNDRKKLEQLYRDALKEEIIHLDAWIGLVNLYITDNNKSEEDLIKLAEEIAEVYTYHPLPMYDLTRRISSKVTSPAYRSRLMMLQDETLRKATKATGKETLYHKEVPVIANALLGIVDSKVATFSFNGANAGKIILSKQLQSAQVAWKYSLDGGKKWTDCFESSAELTKEEIASINTTNDIKIHITGLPMTEANIYTIDITNAAKPTGIVVNDFEDRMYGTTAAMEWTLDPNGEWTSFATSNPLFSGNKRVYVRTIANGTNMPSEAVYFTFTDNSGADNKRYIKSSFLSVPIVSGTQTGNKNNIVDGNTKTYWRSVHGKLDAPYIPAYVIIELQEPRFVTALDYTHDSSALAIGSIPYGFAKNVDIYVSMDNKNWTKVASKTFADKNNSAQQVVFDEVLQAKYVKFDCKSVHTGAYNTLAIGEITLYEDTTAEPNPRAEVNYNIVKKTNKNVVAELVNPTRSITVTNNGGKTTRTFTQNGEFTFEFVDKNGNKGASTAKVDWIDKTPPKATVEFNTTKPTNENVVATLSFDKEVTILSEDVQVAVNPVDKSKTITFLENGTFDLKFADELGNIGTKKISVDWIDTIAPTAEFAFNTTHLTDGEVIATLKPSEKVTIINNAGKDTYTFTENGEFTFEFVDQAGNVGTATVNVNWIAKLPKYEIKYSTKSLTKDDVLVTLELEEGYQIFNNNANKEYIFTENGTFSFQYKDEYGNDGLIPVTVDWIDKEEPTAELLYSTNKWTNKNVIVTIKPSEEVTITNNNNNTTYTFTENGEFKFEFVDKVGNVGTAIAKVDWIDKVAPTGTISYSTKDKTEGPVIATLKPSEEITVTNNSNKTTYTFTENGEFTFKFVDKAGNVGTATAKVDWIEKKADEKPDDNTGEDKPTNPSKPDDNTGEDKPTNPSKPDDNTGDDKPTKPSKPDDNTGEDKPTNPSKPDDNTGDDKPTKPSKPDDNAGENKPNSSKYQKYSIENIIVEIPENNVKENMILKKIPIMLNSSLLPKFGKNSEYFELSFQDELSEKIDVNTKIKITIELDKTKEFLGIYEISDDNQIKTLSHKVNEDGTIEIETENLGKYAISYKELEITDKEQAHVKRNNNSVWFIASGTVLIAGTTILALKKRKK